MNGETIIKVLLLGVALSMDAFAVSIADSLIYSDINKKKSFFIAATFGIMQALMPLIGYWIVELMYFIAGSSGGKEAANIMALIVTWVAFGLLLLIGIKMIIEGIKITRKPKENRIPKKFSVKEVLFMGIVTSIDALAVGVSLHAGISSNTTIWLHVVIIMVITFIISLVGLFLGDKIEKLFKGKYEISEIIGGAILIALAIWVVISHYLGI